MKNVTCCHQSQPDTSSEREVLFRGQKVFLGTYKTKPPAIV